MLIIRREQIAAFQSDAEKRTDQNLADYARRRFPNRFASVANEMLLEFVAEVRQNASKRSIFDVKDVATALDLSVMYHPHFYDLDWVRDIFASTLSPTDKMSVLRERVVRRIEHF